MIALTAAHNSDVRHRIFDAGQQLIAGKAFSAVGLNEILQTANVPKGSFYHYFGSKDAFGEELLADYFESYLAKLDETLEQTDQTMAQRVMNYWRQWQENQAYLDFQGKCLVVKLATEVTDLSEAMRAALDRGTSGIISRLRNAIEAGVKDGSIAVEDDPGRVAESLYQIWMGSSVMVKVVRNAQPFETATSMTRQLLHLSP